MPKTFLSEKPKNPPGDWWEHRTQLWEWSDVPERHRETRPSQPGPWMDAKRALVGHLGSGGIMVLTGRRGTGKTQLGVEAIRSYCWEDSPAKYVKAIDVFLSIREGMAERSERAAVKPYLIPQLLVIDAMEERGETPWEDRMLNYILDKRYDAMMDTILITNQERGRFAESVGASIISRIHEAGGVIECNWESFREEKKEDRPRDFKMAAAGERA